MTKQKLSADANSGRNYTRCSCDRFKHDMCSQHVKNFFPTQPISPTSARVQSRGLQSALNGSMHAFSCCFPAAYATVLPSPQSSQTAIKKRNSSLFFNASVSGPPASICPRLNKPPKSCPNKPCRHAATLLDAPVSLCLHALLFCGD